jgi:hypothetical protein
MNHRLIIFAALIASGLAAPVSSACAAPPPHSIGYVGCSNTLDSVIGYQFTPGAESFWPIYDINGYSIELWARTDWLHTWFAGERETWQAFTRQVELYGRPKYVWVQLCENYSKEPDTYAQVRSLLTVLRTHMPQVDVFVSAINAYQPKTDLCKAMGPQGQGETDTIRWRDQAVADGLAKKGPDMGPLTASLTIADGCHPNKEGMLMLGRQLHDFFDTLP